MEQTGATERSLAALTPRVTRAWYVLCRSEQVRRRPIRRRLFGRPLAVFRTGHGVVHALEDRCPHRSVPLSEGRVVGDELECRYHGWRFDGDGACTKIPALEGEPGSAARRALALPVLERQGHVWAWGDTEHPPEGEPPRFHHADDPEYLVVTRSFRVPGAVHQVIENALDVPHTAFLHGGLFRNDRAERKPIRCEIRRYHDRAECWFHGEERPEGIAGRLLSPSGGEVTHVDRFRMPSLTEVEYRIGTENHLVLNGACTPLDDFETELHAVVQIRSRLPRWLIRPLVEPIALRIFAQDADILDSQTRTMHGFGEARFTSTDIDVLGTHILRLMQRAARGEAGDPDAPPYTRETTMWV